MTDGQPALAPRAKPAQRPGRALLLAVAWSLLGLGAQAAPVISSISPESGSVSNGVTVTGTGFGASKGTSTVTFGGTEASGYSSWSDTRIEVLPPTSLGFGASAVVVTVGGEASNGVEYRRLPWLRAACSDRRLREPSGSVTIGVSREGTGSGALLVSVTYGGTATNDWDYVAPETLTIEAGKTAAQGTLFISDDSGREGNETIIVQVSAEGFLSHSCEMTLEDNDPDGKPAPVITRLSPAAAGVGGLFTITGSNFGATKGSSRVTMNKRWVPTRSWSDTSITVAVPGWVTTGDVLVRVGGQASNGVAFTVVPHPVISRLDPTQGPVGTSESAPQKTRAGLNDTIRGTER